MKAADILDRITPLKRRLTGHQWYILLTLCAHPGGMTCAEIYKSMWCGSNSGILRSLGEFEALGIVERHTVVRDCAGRSPYRYTPTEKAFSIMGLEQ